VKNIENVTARKTKCFEFIIVDDGSEDKTVELLEKLLAEKQLEHVKIIEAMHGGVSSARNIGIEHSTGKYITFVDSDDDFLFPEKIVELENVLAQNADLIYCNLNIEKKIDTAILENKLDILQSMSALGNISIYPSVCGKFYKRSFIVDNNILFDDSLRVGEDVIFSFKCLERASSLILSNLETYIIKESSSGYLFNEQNLTNEMHFREKILALMDFYGDNAVARKIDIRFGITGILFLIECYYAPLVQKKRLNFSQASSNLKKVIKTGNYSGFDSDLFDRSLSKRGKIFRKLIDKEYFKTIFVLISLQDRLKGIRR